MAQWRNQVGAFEILVLAVGMIAVFVAALRQWHADPLYWGQ